MTNKQIIRAKVKEVGCKLGTYHNVINALKKPEIEKILDSITGDSTDVFLDINNDKYVVEIFNVDNELDFSMISYDEYVSMYGEPEED